jgi:hypothetical protein
MRQFHWIDWQNNDDERNPRVNALAPGHFEDHPKIEDLDRHGIADARQLARR